ncbi:MAG: hypothetical protein ABSD77_08405 [Verrucomicrobiota bacterium]
MHKTPSSQKIETQIIAQFSQCIRLAALVCDQPNVGHPTIVKQLLKIKSPELCLPWFGFYCSFQVFRHAAYSIAQRAHIREKNLSAFHQFRRNSIVPGSKNLQGALNLSLA